MAPKSKRGKAAAAAKAADAKAKKAGPNTIEEAVVKVSDRSVTGNNASRPGSNDIKFVNFSLSYFGEVRDILLYLFFYSSTLVYFKVFRSVLA
jgi:hypothetical protein